jgi:hypothetical protein
MLWAWHVSPPVVSAERRRPRKERRGGRAEVKTGEEEAVTKREGESSLTHLVVGIHPTQH